MNQLGQNFKQLNLQGQNGGGGYGSQELAHYDEMCNLIYNSNTKPDVSYSND